MRHSPEIRGADERGVLFERAGERLACRGPPGFPAFRHFRLGDFEREPAGFCIDDDAIAVPDQRQRSADPCFRRDIADHHAAGGAGEAAIGEQRDLLAHALPVDQRGHRKHLAHARPALGTFVANHQHFALRIRARRNHGGAVFLAVEHARPAAELQVLESGDLDERAIGREVALEHHQSAGVHDRRLAHHLAVRARVVGQFVLERRAEDREALAVQRAALQQHAQHVVHAAHGVQVLGEKAPAGLHVRDQRRLLRDPGEVIQRESDPRFMGDCGDMQSRVGRAAGRGNRRAGVLQTFLRHQVARARPAGAQKLHHHAACFARGGRPFLGHRGHGGRARQREAQGLGDHRHRVGGELAGTGAQRRQAHALELVELGGLHFAGHHRADRLEGIEHRDVAPLPPAGRGRAAVHEDRRQVETDDGHHHAGQGLVAARESHQRIVGVPSAHGFHAIGDDLARGERELHARVAHRHRIGHRDRGEVERHAAPLFDRDASLASELAELRIAGRHPAIGARHANERLGDVLVGQPEAAQEGAMRRAVHAFDRDARRQVAPGGRFSRTPRSRRLHDVLP